MRLVALLLLAQGVMAQQPASTSAVIGEIRVERLDVFDPRVPGENLFFYRWANKIHVTTREDVIRRELLLKPGDLWDPLKGLESERLLRSNGFFRKVSIAPRSSPSGKLDLEVKTQDSWTTQAQFSIGTEGGQHFMIYGLSENNVLGSNKSLGFIHAQVGPKIRNIFRYSDPRLWGTRFQLSTIYASTHRGESKSMDIKRPFFSLETPYAVHSGWSRMVQEQTIYEDSLEKYHFLGDIRTVRAGSGLRLPWNGPMVQRAQAEWYFEEDRFSALEDTQALPSDRKRSGPLFGYSWVMPRYIKETYIDRMERDEDFNLGNELDALAGPVAYAEGVERDQWQFNVADQQGLSLGPGRFLLGQIGASGRRAGNRLRNSLSYANLNLFWKTPGPWLPQTWVVHAESARGLNLDPEHQVLLGGSNGLRGYRSFSFAGSKSLLFNLENRFFIPREFFHLFRFGGAIFFDAGQVAPDAGSFALRRFKTDVGLGLRISQTRSTGGRVMRIDLAYALNPGPGNTRLVLAVRGGQAFSLFSSSTRHIRQAPRSRLESSRSQDFSGIQ